MSACVDATMEVEMKPFELCQLICAELCISLDSDKDNTKPKDIVALANQMLGREASSDDATTTVKKECMALRQAIRDLPPSFWGEEKVNGNSSPEALVTRLLLKPASTGGFCSGAACKRMLKTKGCDMKSIVSQGALDIDGFNILTSPGQYSTLDIEMETITLLFGSKQNSTKFSRTVFMVTSREQVAPGKTILQCKANKCNARLAALVTPKFCLVGFYNYVGPESEQKTLAIFEQIRLEAAGSK